MSSIITQIPHLPVEWMWVTTRQGQVNLYYMTFQCSDPTIPNVGLARYLVFAAFSTVPNSRLFISSAYKLFTLYYIYIYIYIYVSKWIVHMLVNG